LKELIKRSENLCSGSCNQLNYQGCLYALSMIKEETFNCDCNLDCQKSVASSYSSLVECYGKSENHDLTEIEEDEEVEEDEKLNNQLAKIMSKSSGNSSPLAQSKQSSSKMKSSNLRSSSNRKSSNSRSSSNQSPTRRRVPVKTMVRTKVEKVTQISNARKIAHKILHFHVRVHRRYVVKRNNNGKSSIVRYSSSVFDVDPKKNKDFFRMFWSKGSFQVGKSSWLVDSWSTQSSHTKTSTFYRVAQPHRSTHLKSSSKGSSSSSPSSSKASSVMASTSEPSSVASSSSKTSPSYMSTLFTLLFVIVSIVFYS